MQTLIENAKTFVEDHKTTLIKVGAAVLGAAIGVAVVVVVTKSIEELPELAEEAIDQIEAGE